MEAPVSHVMAYSSQTGWLQISYGEKYFSWFHGITVMQLSLPRDFIYRSPRAASTSAVGCRRCQECTYPERGKSQLFSYTALRLM